MNKGFEVEGAYGKAFIHTDVHLRLDATQDELANLAAVTADVIELLNQRFSSGAVYHIMPDAHPGKGCVVGTTIDLNGVDAVCPNLVGVDIGCSVTAGFTGVKLSDINLQTVNGQILKEVPLGFDTHVDNRYVTDEVASVIASLFMPAAEINLARAYRSVGTLGGGNHFIELAINENNEVYILVHTGSRNLGKTVADYYQDWAVVDMQDNHDKARMHIIQNVPHSLMDATLRSLPLLPKKELRYLTGELALAYMHDMRLAQQYALLNHSTIIENISRVTGLPIIDSLTTSHNYIGADNILRKGAVSAKKGEALIIPINSEFGSIIAVGKGNSEWNTSAPHGAGRLMSRKAAKERYTVAEYEQRLDDAGVYSTCVSTATLDESPMAYKAPEAILNLIDETVIPMSVKIIKPVLNIKAGGD